MALPIYQVDAFADGPFTGNPAAVCLLDGQRDDSWLQSVAAEMNLSETAFLLPRDDGYDLRWFTPGVEVDLCGHATLASAHVLWSEGRAAAGKDIHFHSRSGVLIAKRAGDLIELDFPLVPQRECERPDGLFASLGIDDERDVYLGVNRFDYLVELPNASAVRDLCPDFQRLSSHKIRGVIVTAKSDDERFDFISRFFAPGAGIDEDPVTGSAHCCLAAYWQQRLGKDNFTAFQASPRGGIVNVRVAGDRAILGGRAVTVLRGELTC